jgi:DNA processing protein
MKEELPSAKLEFLAHIFEVCTSIDSVVDRTGLTVTEVSQMLLELELQGMVASVPGGYIRIGTGG